MRDRRSPGKTYSYIVTRKKLDTPLIIKRGDVEYKVNYKYFIESCKLNTTELKLMTGGEGLEGGNKDGEGGEDGEDVAKNGDSFESGDDDDDDDSSGLTRVLTSELTSGRDDNIYGGGKKGKKGTKCKKVKKVKAVKCVKAVKSGKIH